MQTCPADPRLKRKSLGKVATYLKSTFKDDLQATYWFFVGKEGNIEIRLWMIFPYSPTVTEYKKI